MNKFDSMPNFRKLNTKNEKDNLIENCIDNDGELKEALNCQKIYRSSKPDYLTQHDIPRFCDLGFRTIIDLRSYEEYRKGDGDKLLDKFYPLYKVKLPQWRNYSPGENLILKKLKLKKVVKPTLSNQNDGIDDLKSKKQTPQLDSESSVTSPLLNTQQPQKRHILINFFNFNLIWDVFNRISFLQQLISLFILAFDFIMRTDKRYFVRYMAKHCLNSSGVRGLYVDIINLAQASIYAALKLLTEPDNLPAMLNCAHGKDRTGIVSALVLSTLGYSREHIVRDFARSAVELEPIKEQIIADTVGRMHVTMAFTGADPETMEYTLDYIDQNYGGVTSYLEKIGFTIADQNLLRKNLLQGSSD